MIVIASKIVSNFKQLWNRRLLRSLPFPQRDVCVALFKKRYP